MITPPPPSSSWPAATCAYVMVRGNENDDYVVAIVWKRRKSHPKKWTFICWWRALVGNFPSPKRTQIHTQTAQQIHSLAVEIAFKLPFINIWFPLPFPLKRHAVGYVTEPNVAAYLLHTACALPCFSTGSPIKVDSLIHYQDQVKFEWIDDARTDERHQVRVSSYRHHNSFAWN